MSYKSEALVSVVSAGYWLKGTLRTPIYLECQSEFKSIFESGPNEPK